MAIERTGIYKDTTSRERFILGTEALLDNLAKELGKIEGRLSTKGMREVLLLLEGKAMSITPWKTGNLAGSYSTEVVKEPDGVIGYLINNASYALFVHEMPASFNYTKPGTGPKFIENPLRENYAKFFDILKNSAKIP